MPVRVHSTLLAIIVVVSAVLVLAGRVGAAVQSSVMVKADPEVIAADGKSTTTITAIARGGDGSLVPDGTPITFSSTLGVLSGSTATTASGAARITLTSTATPGRAQVTATYIDTTGGGVGQGTCAVEFTSDTDTAGADASSRWLRVECSEYLIYSADAKMIQAEGGKVGGKKVSARLRYKGLSIEGESIQVDVQAMSVIARNVTMRHGRASLVVAELDYDLYTSTGTAVLPGSDTTSPKSVTVTGAKFDTVPLSAAAADEAMHTHVYGEDDLSTSRLIISARAISVDPGSQIQFTRATLYSDGKKVMSMAFHVMPLTTNQLFGEQIIGYSSQGLFVNVPYYYHVSPDSMGTLYIRNSAAADAGIATALAPTFGADGARPGLELDMMHTYTVGSTGNGSFVLNGLTRSDWGGYWNHSQRIDPFTSTYFYVDYPEHRGIYGTSTVRRELPYGYSLSVQASETDNPMYDGYASSSSMLNTYLSSPTKRLGKSPFNMVSSVNWAQGIVSESEPSLATIVTPVSTQGASMRLFTSPLKPDKQTTLSDSLALGASYSELSKAGSPTLQGTVGATRSLPHTGQIALNYNYTFDPELDYSQQVSAGPGMNLLNAPFQQTVSLTGNFVPSKRSSLNLSTNYALPIGNIMAFGFYNYQLTNDLGIGLNALYQHTYIGEISSLEISVTRRILGRTLVFTYGTDTHRIRFDFGAGQF